MGLIKCSKHGLVEGVFCRECRAEKYVEGVKSGNIQSRPLVESRENDCELLPLQIRFRAFVERKNRRLLDRAYSWEKRSRVVRIVPSNFMENI